MVSTHLVVGRSRRCGGSSWNGRRPARSVPSSAGDLARATSAAGSTPARGLGRAVRATTDGERVFAAAAPHGGYRRVPPVDGRHAAILDAAMTDDERILIRRAGPAARRGRHPRREELGAQADGGHAAGRRRVHAHQRARHRRRRHHGRPARGHRCAAPSAPAPGELRMVNRGDITPVAPYELVERIRASDQRARPAARPLRPGVAVAARRRRLRQPPDRHAPQGPRGDGRHVRAAPRRASRRTRRSAARRRHHPRVPQRRRHREHPHGGRARQGHHGHRQRGPRARDRRPVPLPGARWAPHIEGIGTSHARRARRRARRAARHRPRGRCPTASRPPPTSPRWPSAAARWCCAAPAPTTWTCCCAASTTWASRSRRRRHDGLAVWSHGAGCAAIDVATLPYPGIATDYKPLIVTMLGRRRRRRHRHREPVPRPLPLRRGAAAPGRRHPHRRPPRRGARRAASSAARRCVPPTSVPVRRWWSPGWPPRARPSVSGVHHIDRGYDDLVGRLAALGADIERVG